MSGITKLYPRYHPCLTARRLEKFHEDTATFPEVIGMHAVNFKPNFKCSRLKLFGRPHPHWCVCVLASLDQSLAHVKFEGAAPPKGWYVVS